MPRIFDIFSPSASTTKPWCIQWLAKRLPERHGLGPLVLVVGELEVEAAAVEVEALAEQVERHDDALGVPARAAVAPRRRPRRLARLGQLPEREVGRVALVLGADDLAVAAAGAQVGERLAGRAARSRAPSRRSRYTPSSVT